MIMSPSITVFLSQYNFLFSIFLGVVCPASAVDHARLLGTHCRHSNAEIPMQCEADMSGKSVSHQEETGVLETRGPASYRLYI